MTNAWRGALWSAFGSPGVGQIVLKSYRRGIIQLSVFMVIMLAYIMEEVRLANTLVQKIMAQGASIDEQQLEKMMGSGSLLSNVLGWLILICWIAGIIDAYRIGRRKDILASPSAREDTLYPQI